MASFTVSAHSNQSQGTRERQEDSAVQFQTKTRSGLTLQLAIVCDGAGGGEAGELASRIAITTIEKSINTSHQSDIIKLLIEAVQSANAHVYRELAGSGYSTAAVIAVILSDDPPSVYIASVGDSPIYLYYRDAKKIPYLVRLNINHSLLDDPLYDGERERNGRTDLLTRSVGGGPTVNVDVGRYIYQGKPVKDPRRAEELGLEGFDLSEGYTLFAASDGLQGTTEGGGPALLESEILHHVEDKEVERAANLLIDYASARRPLDNVSIAMIFADGPNRRNKKPLNAPGLTTAFKIGGFLTLIVTLAVMGFLVTAIRRQLDVNSAQSILGTEAAIEAATIQVALAVTSTPLPDLPTTTPLPTNTPPPTATIAPTLVANEVAQVFSRASGEQSALLSSQPLMEDQVIAPDSRVVIHGGNLTSSESEKAQILVGGSQTTVDLADHRRQELILRVNGQVPGSSQDPLFVVNGFYQLRVDLGIVEINVPRSLESCIAVQYVETQIRLECLANECSYGSATLIRDQYALIDPATNQSLTSGVLTKDDVYPLWQQAQSMQMILPTCLTPLLDPDKDAFVNYGEEDGCPEQSGTVEGCPDADNDKVPESRDQCANSYGPASNRGCPLDDDGDGIPNNQDRCPRDKGTRQQGGCPADTDRDGVYDDVDSCINQYGSPANKGCPVDIPATAVPVQSIPDSDGDGVADDRDQCLSVAGPDSNNGCPSGGYQ